MRRKERGENTEEKYKEKGKDAVNNRQYFTYFFLLKPKSQRTSTLTISER